MSSRRSLQSRRLPSAMVFAQLHWIEEGGTLDEASFESAPGFGAYIFHVERRNRTSHGACVADRLVLREDSARRQVGSHRPGIHNRPDRSGHSVAPLGPDWRGAWRDALVFGVAVMAATGGKPAVVEETAVPASVA